MVRQVGLCTTIIDTEVYSSYSGDEYAHELEGLEQAFESAGLETVDEVIEQVSVGGVDTNSVILHGVPHEEIRRYSDENEIDLVVRGTKDRRGSIVSYSGVLPSGLRD